jgi:hypothetical protein
MVVLTQLKPLVQLHSGLVAIPSHPNWIWVEMCSGTRPSFLIVLRPFIFHINKKNLLQVIFVEQFNQSFDQNLLNNIYDLKMSKDNMF